MVTGSWATQALYVAAKLAIPDLLADGPRSARQLAQASGAHPGALYRLLRALSAMGVFRELPGQTFRQTAISRTLVSGHRSLMREVAIMAGEERYAAWGELLYSISTGKAAFDRVHRRSFYPYFASQGASGRRFEHYLRTTAQTIAAGVAHAYDFSRVQEIVDVGGGHGEFITTLLRSYPHMRGVLLETEPVTKMARKAVRAAGLSRRCRVVAGDFFQSVPRGGDTYILVRILHGFDDGDSVRILKSCRRAMSQSKLLIVQEVLTSAPTLGKLADLNMLVVFGGKERTRVEYRQLLAQAEFKLTRVAPTETSMSIIEAAPV